MSKLYCQHKNDPDTETFSLSFAESDKQAQAVTLPARMKEAKELPRQLKVELIKSSIKEMMEEGQCITSC